MLVNPKILNSKISVAIIPNSTPLNIFPNKKEKKRLIEIRISTKNIISIGIDTPSRLRDSFGDWNIITHPKTAKKGIDTIRNGIYFFLFFNILIGYQKFRLIVSLDKI